MARLLSGRVKVTPPTGVSTDRYSYLRLEEAEPNAGLPGVDGYVLASDLSGNRFWRSAPGASAVNGLTIKEDGVVVGTAASVNSINFVSTNLTATSSGAGATVTFNDSPTFTDLTVSGIATATTFQAPGGTYASGSDTKTDAALVIDANSSIYTQHQGLFLRTLIENDNGAINIGQSATSLITSVNLYPGNNGDTNLYHGANKKLQTTTNGIEVTGTTDTDQLNVSGISTFQSVKDLNVTGVSTFQDNVNLGDNNRLRLGDSNDLQIYHDSTSAQSRIEESGGGSLVIKGTDLYLQTGDGENILFGDANGAVNLYYDATKKFETTNTGVKITGNLQFSTAGINAFTITGFGTNYSVSSSVNSWAAQPMATEIWHDLFAFQSHYTTTYETFNGSGWFFGNVDSRLFAQKEDQSITVATGSPTTAVRWTFQGTAWGGAEWLVIGHAWNSGTSNKTILVESGTDGSTWTTRHESTYTNIATSMFHYLGAYNGDSYIRVTITRNGSSTGDVNLSNIKLLTDRPGDQGQGKEYHYPYSWDGQKNITTRNNLTVPYNFSVSGVSTFQGNVFLGDDDKIVLGAGNDLQIWHSGSNSIIQDSGVGNLIIRGENLIQFQNANGTETYANFNVNGAVALHYDNSKKFETTGYGVTVFGTLETQQLNVSGISTFQSVKDLNVTGIATISGLKYPTTDGVANQVVATDGNGNLSLQTLSDLEGFNWETVEQDFGLITEVVNDSPDNGLVSDAVTSFGYDLGFIVVTGLIYPTQFVLPSFSVSSLPSVNPAGQMLFVTDETGGSVPAFSDGTNWRRVTDRQIVS
jgi:hypothetical protein